MSDNTTMTDAPTPESDRFSYPLMGRTDSLFIKEMRRLEVERDEARALATQMSAEREHNAMQALMWRACAERLAKELRDYDEVLCGGLSTRNALAEFDGLKGKEGA